MRAALLLVLVLATAVHGLREYPTTQWVKDAKRWATVMRQTAETLRGKDTPDAWLFYLGMAVVRHEPALAQRLVKSIEAICPQDGTVDVRCGTSLEDMRQWFHAGRDESRGVKLARTIAAYDAS